jgi:RND family efflux transporter MFP subunit
VKKSIIIFIALAYLSFMGCKENVQEDAGSHDHAHSEEAHQHEHDEENSEHVHTEDEGHEHQADQIQDEHTGHDHSENQEGEADEHEHNSHAAHNHGDEEQAEESHDNHEGHDHSQSENMHTGHGEFGHYHVETLKARPFKEVIATSGEVLTMPNSKQSVVAPAAGVVSFASSSLLEGKEVKKGQLLFIIRTEAIAGTNLQSELKQAKAKLERVKRDYERAGKLVENQVISKREHQAREAALKAAEAEVEALAQHAAKGGALVRASQSGYISNLEVSSGTFVSAGQTIGAIENRDKLLLKAEVSQRFAHMLPDVSNALFSTQNKDFRSLADYHGKRVSLGKSVQPDSYYIPVYFGFDNPGDIYPGSFMQIYLEGAERDDVLFLPKGAFIEQQGNFFVFVQEHGEFEKRPVKVGATNGQEIEILSGVKAGEKVVSHGAYQVKLMTTSSALPAHNHSH